MKLKIDGVDKMICSYCAGDGLQTSKSFKRRAYWYINEPKYILVHYLDTQLEQQQVFPNATEITDTRCNTTNPTKSNESKEEEEKIKPK